MFLSEKELTITFGKQHRCTGSALDRRAGATRFSTSTSAFPSRGARYVTLRTCPRWRTRRGTLRAPLTQTYLDERSPDFAWPEAKLFFIDLFQADAKRVLRRRQ